MASARSGGRAGPRDEEANGDLDRSLQQMLRAIAEERSRAGLRQEISGLGESSRAGGPGGGRGEPPLPRRRRPLRGLARRVPVPPRAAGGGGLETCWVAAGRGAAAGTGPSSFRSPPGAGGSSGLAAPLSAVPLEKNGPKALRASAGRYRYVFKHKLRVIRFGIQTQRIFCHSSQRVRSNGSQTISVGVFFPLLSQTPPFSE